MKKIICSLLFLCAAISILAQSTTSFLVADKNGNSYLVQSLIFQRDSSSKSYWLNGSSLDNRDKESFDISNLQFIARVKSDMTTATSEEVTEILEGLSGGDEADAEIVAAALQCNENVEEAYTADGNNVIVKEKGCQYYTAYPFYDLQPTFADNQVSEEIEEMINASQSPRKVHLYDRVPFGRVAIFNFFSGDKDYSLQNLLVNSIYRRFYDNNYDVTLYKKKNFTEANLKEVLAANKNNSDVDDYMAIIIFSHGMLRDRSTMTNGASADLITGEEVAEYNICDRWFNSKDGKYYKTIPMAMDPGKECILYMGACYGTCWGQSYFGDNIRDKVTLVGWNGINSISQAHAAIMFDKMLYRGMTLSAAIATSFQSDPFNSRTSLECSWSRVYNYKFKNESRTLLSPQNDYVLHYDWGDFYTKYPELNDENCIKNVSVTFDNNKDILIRKYLSDTPRYLYFSGRVEGNYGNPVIKIRIVPITGKRRRAEGKNGYDFIVLPVSLSNNNRFNVKHYLPGSLSEGVYEVQVFGYERKQGKMEWNYIKKNNTFYFIYSTRLSDNYALPESADEETQIPLILDSDGQQVEEITLPASSSRVFTIQGYTGHTFKAVSLDKDVADVSVTGNTLTVNAIREDSTYIAVYDVQNKQITIAMVTVTESGGGTAYLTCPNDNHPHPIDLGLPSGTKWACCNVGASTPEGYGGHYAWGETSAKSYFGGWDTSQCEKYHNGGQTELLPEDDAATVNWGAPWRMPTISQQQELLDNCSSEWTQRNGVNGRLVTSNLNGGQIFLPAAGWRIDGGLYDAGSGGDYWSSSLYPGDDSRAYDLGFYSTAGIGTYWEYRNHGFSVRPVCVP